MAESPWYADGIVTISVGTVTQTLEVEKVVKWLTILKKKTKTASPSLALTAIQFSDDVTAEERAMMAELIDVMRAAEDGAITPPLDIEAMYQGIPAE